jgi:hypothetical protein
MDNKCSFCSKPLSRQIFCSPSCKTRYHRGDKKPEKKTEARPNPVIDSLPVSVSSKTSVSEVATALEATERLDKFIKEASEKKEREGLKVCEHGGYKPLCKKCIAKH